MPTHSGVFRYRNVVVRVSQVRTAGIPRLPTRRGRISGITGRESRREEVEGGGRVDARCVNGIRFPDAFPQRHFDDTMRPSLSGQLSVVSVRASQVNKVCPNQANGESGNVRTRVYVISSRRASCRGGTTL